MTQRHERDYDPAFDGPRMAAEYAAAREYLARRRAERETPPPREPEPGSDWSLLGWVRGWFQRR